MMVPKLVVLLAAWLEKQLLVLPQPQLESMSAKVTWQATTTN